MDANIKAVQLVEKYFRLLFINIKSHEQTFYPKECKQCALIAVDEIMKLEVWDNPFDNIHYGLIFWEEVKKEINLI